MKKLTQGCTVKFIHDHGIYFGMITHSGLDRYPGSFKNTQEHFYTIKTDDGELYNVKLSSILEVEERGTWLLTGY